MLDCAIGTFVDRQEAIRYPIGYISRYWHIFKKCYWFTSDDANAAALESELAGHPRADRIQIVPTGFKINNPSDLMPMWRMVIDKLRDSGCRFIARQEADLCLTDLGVRAIIENIGRPFTIPSPEYKLYCQIGGVNPVGAVVLAADGYHILGPNSDWEVYLRSGVDGDDLQRDGLREGDPDEKLMIGLSYFDTRTYARKEASHWNLWPDDEKKAVVAAFGRSKREGILAAIPKIKRESPNQKLRPAAYSGQIKKIIDDLGLLQDYNDVMDVLGTQ